MWPGAPVLIESVCVGYSAYDSSDSQPWVLCRGTRKGALVFIERCRCSSSRKASSTVAPLHWVLRVVPV